jgi:hypothetical protein
MQKSFASYKLKVLHYELLKVEKTHPIFKSPWHLKEKCFEFNFFLIYINH